MPRIQPPFTARLLRACAPVAALLLAGCLGLDSNQTISPSSATLSLTVTPPPGIAVQLTITGPQSFTKTVAASGATTVQLLGLTPGTYTFAAPVIVVPTSLVDTVWSADLTALPGGKLVLAAGQAGTLEVKYAVREGSGSIVLTRFGDARALGLWPAAGLLEGRNPPATQEILTSYQDWAGIAVDADGVLWLLANDLSTSSFLQFAPALLASGAAPTPTVLQAGGRLDAFCLDGAGGIWGASRSEQKLYHWLAATIVGGNLLTPDVIVQGAAGALQAPVALALDAVGSLWVANAAVGTSTGTVVRLAPRQLATSGYALPTVELPVDAPSALAFDAMGDLWALSGPNTLLQFGTAQLSGTAATPAATIALDADATATALAFDALGDLFFTLTHATDASSALAMLTPGQLAKSGTPIPFVALKTAAQMGAPALLLIDPTPAGLPLAGAPK